MKTYCKLLITILLLVAFLFVGCRTQAEIALRVTGNVVNEKGWTEDQIKQMEVIEAEYTDKQGVIETHTGVLIADLLDEAGMNNDAITVIFVGDDGYTAEATLAEVLSCVDCIVSFQEQGGLSIVMPDFPSKLQVKGVIELQVQ